MVSSGRWFSHCRCVRHGSEIGMSPRRQSDSHTFLYQIKCDWLQQWQSYKFLVRPVDHLAIFARSKMRALKSHRYVKIWIKITAFIIAFSTFIQYCPFNLSVVWNLTISNNDEVTDVLAWPPNDLYVMKNVCIEKIQLRKNTWVWNDISEASDSAFTVNVRCVSPFAQTFSCFANSSTACASLSLSETSCHVGLLLRLHALLFWLLPENYQVSCYFGNLRRSRRRQQ